MNVMDLKLNFSTKLNQLFYTKKYRKPGTYNHIITRRYYISERPAAPKKQIYRSLNQSSVKKK